MQNLLQTPLHREVMLARELTGEQLVQHPKDVVWSRRGTGEKQKPRILQILDMWDPVHVPIPLLTNCGFAQRSAQHTKTLPLWRKSVVSTQWRLDVPWHLRRVNATSVPQVNLGNSKMSGFWPHPIFSTILGRPHFSAVGSTFLAEEEAQNLDFSPHPKFWPFLGPLLGHPFDLHQMSSP